MTQYFCIICGQETHSLLNGTTVCRKKECQEKVLRILKEARGV